MKWLIIALTTAMLTRGELPPPDRSYKILMLSPISPRGHRDVFVALAEVLAIRGHKVVMFTNNNEDHIKEDNINEFSHGIKELDGENADTYELLRGRTIRQINEIPDILDPIVEKFFALSEVNELYRKRKIFDLVIINGWANEIILPFAHEMTSISLAPEGIEYHQSAQLGNPLNPSYVPCDHLELSHSMTFLERIGNLLCHVRVAFAWNTLTIVPFLQNKLSTRFPNLPPLLDIQRNQSLMLTNSHFSLQSPIPRLPNQVEVGGIHCRTAKPLPQDLLDWIKGADDAGVIYLNLESIAQGNPMDRSLRDIILEAFGRLPQRFIWNYHGDLPGIPDNVLIRNRLPIQDILGHPKVKLYITDGDLPRLQEAVYHGKQVIVLPQTQGQVTNGRTTVDWGIGLSIPAQELTSADVIIKAVFEILGTTKYQENVNSLAETFKDQQESPNDRAIYWTEYVIRHKGAIHLRSEASQLSWIEYLLIDAIIALLFTIGLVIFIFRRASKICFGYLKDKLVNKNDLLCLPIRSKEKAH